MNDPTAKRKDEEHLSNIQIAFVLAFNKVKTSQWEIMKYIKCSRGAVWNILDNYIFDTFNG